VILDNPLTTDLDAAVERGEHFLRPLAGERVFVTGGTGFVGAWLLELLSWANRRLDLDLRVTVLTRSPGAFARFMPHIHHDSHVECVLGDVRDFAFPNGTYAAIVHGAASSDNTWNLGHPGEAVDTIVSGTRRTLEFARQCGAHRFLLLSSGAVYGRQPADVAKLDEEHAGAPALVGTAEAAYGEAKRVAEVLAFLAVGGGLEVVAARIFSCYGPFLPLSAHFAIGNFIRDALLGRPVTVRGDGSPVRAYLYGADLAVGLLACLTGGEPGRAYNIGGEEAVSLGALAHLIAALVEPPVTVRILGEPGPSDRFVPDASRARRVLGFWPAVSLEQGLRATIAWARDTGAPI
jgi:nucleoside-diphosphate-sugar epimerase